MTQIKDTNKFESEMWEVNGKIWFNMVTHGCIVNHWRLRQDYVEKLKWQLKDTLLLTDSTGWEWMKKKSY